MDLNDAVASGLITHEASPRNDPKCPSNRSGVDNSSSDANRGPPGWIRESKPGIVPATLETERTSGAGNRWRPECLVTHQQFVAAVASESYLDVLTCQSADEIRGNNRLVSHGLIKNFRDPLDKINHMLVFEYLKPVLGP
jgi:hypothetical protein